MEKTRMDVLGWKGQATGRMAYREPLFATGAQVITWKTIIISRELAIEDLYCKVVCIDRAGAGTAKGAFIHPPSGITAARRSLCRSRRWPG